MSSNAHQIAAGDQEMEIDYSSQSMNIIDNPFSNIQSQHKTEQKSQIIVENQQNLLLQIQMPHQDYNQYQASQYSQDRTRDSMRSQDPKPQGFTPAQKAQLYQMIREVVQEVVYPLKNQIYYLKQQARLSRQSRQRINLIMKVLKQRGMLQQQPKEIKQKKQHKIPSWLYTQVLHDIKDAILQKYQGLHRSLIPDIVQKSKIIEPLFVMNKDVLKLTKKELLDFVFFYLFLMRRNYIEQSEFDPDINKDQIKHIIFACHQVFFQNHERQDKYKQIKKYIKKFYQSQYQRLFKSFNQAYQIYIDDGMNAVNTYFVVKNWQLRPNFVVNFDEEMEQKLRAVILSLLITKSREVFYYKMQQSILCLILFVIKQTKSGKQIKQFQQQIKNLYSQEQLYNVQNYYTNLTVNPYNDYIKNYQK